MPLLFFICLAFSSFYLPKAQAQHEVPVIHVVGDSHSTEFFLIPGCAVHWLGPITMYRVGRDGLSFLNLFALGVPEGAAVVFVFGEIDVRCHVGKQRDSCNRTLDEVIEALVHHYLYTILLNCQLYQKLTCIVYSVTPPTNIHYNPGFPYYGTIEDRIMISKQLNKRLSEVCSQVGILFLDVYQDYANPDGSLNAAFSDGGVHINVQCYQPIYQKLYQLLNRI